MGAGARLPRGAMTERVFRALLWTVGISALLLGLYARFKGLGAASLSADEYYIARSVDNVLRSGLPEYLCGGYYVRGLTFQYLAAVLRMAGMGAELSARSITVVSSLIALPAVFVLGRRVRGSAVGIAAVAVLAVSIWEVEIARFGRMYMPFQAIFAWYLVFFLRYTVDRKPGALWPMVGLSLLGALTWEGGIFLAITNMLPPFILRPSGRLTGRDIVYLGGNVVLFGLVYLLVSNDLRFAGAVPALPASFDLNSAPSVDGVILDEPATLWSTLPHYVLWTVLAIVPAGIAVYALRWVWTFRARWPAMLGLLLALVLAMGHQLVGFAGTLILLVLIGAVRRNELLHRAAIPYFAAVAAAVVFWLAFGLSTTEWRSGVEETWLGQRPVIWLAYEFVKFPDLLMQVVRPWSGAAPLFALGIAVLVALSLLRLLRREDAPRSAERVLMLIVVCLILAVGVSHPPRQETRYVFFLFPIALMLAIATLTRCADGIGRKWGPTAALAAGLVFIGLYAFSGDFRPRHLLHIDSPEATSRRDLTSRMESHLVPRSDGRGAAAWLTQNTSSDDTVVINAVPETNYYFSEYDSTYIPRENQRYAAYACHLGTVERWGNLQLVDSMNGLEVSIKAHRTAYIVVQMRDAESFMTRLVAYQPKVVWTSIDREIGILQFSTSAAGDRR